MKPIKLLLIALLAFVWAGSAISKAGKPPDKLEFKPQKIDLIKVYQSPSLAPYSFAPIGNEVSFSSAYFFTIAETNKPTSKAKSNDLPFVPIANEVSVLPKKVVLYNKEKRASQAPQSSCKGKKGCFVKLEN